MISVAKFAQPPIRKTEAWGHQCEAYHFAMAKLEEYGSCMLALQMGCGKSKVAVDVAANQDAKMILVLCPLSVVGVWPREFERHYAGEATVVPLNKGGGPRKARLAAEAVARRSPDETVVIVIGYESSQTEAFAKWSLAQRWDLVILDEIHRTKGPQSRVGKHCYKLSRRAKHRLGLTGTPMPHSPLDLWSQFRFLDDKIFGPRYTWFRSRYAITSPKFASQVLSWINQDELKEKYHRLAFRVRSVDVLDLPPLTHETIPCELCPKARKAYHELETEMIADMGAAGYLDLVGRAISGEVVVDNALTKLLRLQQIACGFVRMDDGRILDVDDSKQNALRELIEDIGPRRERKSLFVSEDKDRGPIVVFTTYVYSLAMIRAVVEKLGLTYGELSGRRKDLTAHAEMPPNIDILGVQWQSGSTGIDLTRSAIGVILSPTFNGGDFDQGLARQYRPGQTRHMRFFHLVATDTSDEQVYAALERRRKLVGGVMDKIGGMTG